MRLILFYIACAFLGMLLANIIHAAPQGAIVSPNPVQEYRISNEDGSEPGYFGFTNKYGAWYIMRSSTTGTDTYYSYSVGTTTYNTNWANRALLSYTTFYQAF